MPTYYSTPIEKVISGKVVHTSDICLVSETEYITKGESLVITKDLPNVTVKLDSLTTDHIIVKSMTDTTILPLEGLIDEEYSEIQTQKGASVELYYTYGNWYIVSSDGLKQS